MALWMQLSPGRLRNTREKLFRGGQRHRNIHRYFTLYSSRSKKNESEKSSGGK